MSWIKIRVSLPTDPRVVRMAEILGKSIPEIVGACVMLWAWADTHTATGKLTGVSPASIDSLIGLEKFSEAAQAVDWMRLTDAGWVVLPRFTKHNGQTAKRRALTARRVARCKQRSGNAVGNARVALGARPRAEQSRAEKEKNLTDQTGGAKRADSDCLTDCPQDATVAAMLTRLRIREPARSQIADCADVTPDELRECWRRVVFDRQVSNPRAMLVHEIRTAHGLEKTNGRAPLSASMTLANRRLHDLRETRNR